MNLYRFSSTAVATPLCYFLCPRSQYTSVWVVCTAIYLIREPSRRFIAVFSEIHLQITYLLL